MDTREVRDGESSFVVSVLEVAEPARVVLFAVGAGGDPGRHEPLLAALGAAGCAVVAPHFERWTSLHPTDEQLVSRARRLGLALDAVTPSATLVAGVGHSIGATVLLAMAGGALWTSPRGPLLISRDERLTRLALLAPATGFFRAPGALDRVRLPLLVWAGEADRVTPPGQVGILREALGEQVEARVTRDAGHFSFMDVPPPLVPEPHPDRAAFLLEVARTVRGFVVDRRGVVVAERLVEQVRTRERPPRRRRRA